MRLLPRFMIGSADSCDPTSDDLIGTSGRYFLISWLGFVFEITLTRADQ